MKSTPVICGFCILGNFFGHNPYGDRGPPVLLKSSLKKRTLCGEAADFDKNVFHLFDRREKSTTCYIAYNYKAYFACGNFTRCRGVELFLKVIIVNYLFRNRRWNKFWIYWNCNKFCTVAWRYLSWPKVAQYVFMKLAKVDF